MTIEKTINAFASAFVRKQRDTGEFFYALAKDAPEWMRDAVREAHMEAFPYDARYDLIVAIVESMQGYDVADMEDAISEIADYEVSPYTADRVRWLADHPSHMDATNSAREYGYCDGDTPLVDQIAAGQYYLAGQVARILWGAIQAESEVTE